MSRTVYVRPPTARRRPASGCLPLAVIAVLVVTGLAAAVFVRFPHVWQRLTAPFGMARTHVPGSSPYGVADPALTAPNPLGGPRDPFLTNGAAVLEALGAIAARSGRPLRVADIQADQTRGLTVRVQEPRAHLHLDEYVVAIDGTISGPSPVRVSGPDGVPVTAAMVDADCFDPDHFRLAKLSEAVRAAIVRSKVPDARASSWQIDRTGPGEYGWLVTFDAERSRPNVYLNADATISSISF